MENYLEKDVPMSKVWLITGSSRGLGRALAEAVLAAGHKLVATARDPAQLADLAERHGDHVCTLAINVPKAAIPLMREQRSGHIIQLSSVGGRVGAMGRAPYSAAKWGVEGFSEVLAKEMAPLGVKVTIIEPGGFRTDFAGSSPIF